MPFQTYKKTSSIAGAPTMAVNAAANVSRSGLDALNAFTNQAKSITNAVQASNNVDDQLAKAQRAKTEALLIRGHEAESNNTLRVADVEAREKFGDDEEAYTAHMDGIASGMTESAFSEESAQNIRMYSDKLVTNHSIKLRTEAHNKAQDASIAAVSIEMDSQTTDALNFAHSGDIEAMQESVTALFSNIDDGVESGLITAQKGSQRKLSIGDRITEATIDGGFERALSEGVEQGVEYLARLEANDLTGLNPDQKKSVIKSAKSKLNAKKRVIELENKVNIQEQEAKVKFEGQKVLVQSYMNSREVMDYKNKDHEKAFNQILKESLDGKESTKELRQVVIEQSAEKGILANYAKSAMRVSHMSDNTDQVAKGLDYYIKINEQSPSLLEQIPKTQIAYLESLSTLTGSGLELETAITQTKESLKKPFIERQQSALASINNQETNSDGFNLIATSSLGALIDDEFSFGWRGKDALGQEAMQADYNNLFTHNLGMAVNQEAAITLTNKQIMNKWGASHVTGEAVMTVNSPEQLLAHTKQPVKWITDSFNKMQEDAVALLGEDGVTVKVEDITYKPDAVTLSGVPVYKIYYTDEAGIERPLSVGKGGYWQPSINDSNAGKRIKEDQALGIEKFKRSHERSSWVIKKKAELAPLLKAYNVGKL